jgi:hypothetical protein
MMAWSSVKAGIRNRTTEYIVSENSWPLFVYENYQVNGNNLEEGFLKSKLLVLVSGHGAVVIPFFSHYASGFQSCLHITFLSEGS